MAKYILSIDQGTTSTRAILFNKNGEACYKSQREITCLFPHPAWVEIDPLVIYVSTLDVINEVMVRANIKESDIDSIGISNQRETTIVWEKDTGLPVYNAIIWQSRQSLPICEKLEDKKEFIRERTGLLINPYFSASKIRFILDAIPNGQARAEAGELCFGTVDTWLTYKLTEGKVFMSDVTNASRTLLFNIHTMSWDKDLCALFNIPLAILPTVKPSSYDYGVACARFKDLHITSLVGDQQASLFGQTCFEQGECKNTYGTGCFMLLNVGKNIPLSTKGLLTTVAWQIKDEVTYALEGSIFIGGAVVQWLRDELKLITTSQESETLARKSNLNNEVYVVPAFVGLGTPYWDDKARGAIFNLTRDTSNYDIVRASLEAIAFQSKDVFDTMEKDTGLEISSLKVDGGATNNAYLMQFQSDILNISILLPSCLETTALGAAYLAGLETGFFPSKEYIKNIHSYQKSYEPKMKKEIAKKKYKGWKVAVKATREFKNV